MKIICAPQGFDFDSVDSDQSIMLYDKPEDEELGWSGRRIPWEIRRAKLDPHPRAWDFLTIALSVLSADLALSKDKAPDGWTREYNLTIAVNDPDFWNQATELVEDALKFLSTDIWRLTFIKGEYLPPKPKKVINPKDDCVALLSGGLDSLIGAIDLVKSNHKPYIVSQTVSGDKEKQKYFSKNIGGGISHIQLNHYSKVQRQDSSPPSQRTRSIIFIAYGVLVASSLDKYKKGESVTLYMSENGLISINPPLTGSRLGSLSTRTTHPIFINFIQSILNSAKLNVSIVNNYEYKTKGQMLEGCLDQQFLFENAHKTTSCGRFGRYGRRHCGRCVPCLIRRSSFLKWGINDLTEYVFEDLSIEDINHSHYDDVRSAAIAVKKVNSDGIKSLIGASLNSSILGDVSKYEKVANEGIKELELLLKKYEII